MRTSQKVLIFVAGLLGFLFSILVFIECSWDLLGFEPLLLNQGQAFLLHLSESHTLLTQLFSISLVTAALYFFILWGILSQPKAQEIPVQSAEDEGSGGGDAAITTETVSGALRKSLEHHEDISRASTHVTIKKGKLNVRIGLILSNDHSPNQVQKNVERYVDEYLKNRLAVNLPYHIITSIRKIRKHHTADLENAFETKNDEGNVQDNMEKFNANDSSLLEEDASKEDSSPLSGTS